MRFTNDNEGMILDKRIPQQLVHVIIQHLITQSKEIFFSPSGHDATVKRMKHLINRHNSIFYWNMSNSEYRKIYACSPGPNGLGLRVCFRKQSTISTLDSFTGITRLRRLSFTSKRERFSDLPQWSMKNFRRIRLIIPVLIGPKTQIHNANKKNNKKIFSRAKVFNQSLIDCFKNNNKQVASNFVIFYERGEAVSPLDGYP